MGHTPGERAASSWAGSRLKQTGAQAQEEIGVREDGERPHGAWQAIDRGQALHARTVQANLARCRGDPACSPAHRPRRRSGSPAAAPGYVLQNLPAWQIGPHCEPGQRQGDEKRKERHERGKNNAVPDHERCARAEQDGQPCASKPTGSCPDQASTQAAAAWRRQRQSQPPRAAPWWAGCRSPPAPNPVGCHRQRPQQPDQPQQGLEERKEAVILPKVPPYGATDHLRHDEAQAAHDQRHQGFKAQ